MAISMINLICKIIKFHWIKSCGQKKHPKSNWHFDFQQLKPIITLIRVCDMALERSWWKL